jgi:hypothetical protein
MGPIWDFDRSLNSADGRDDNPATWHGSGDGTDYLGYVWWNRLFEDPEFWQRYIDRWTELRQTTFSDEQINGLIDDMVKEIEEAQVRNQIRWPGVSPRYGGYAQEIGALKDWLARRTAWVDAQFVRPPVFFPAQGYVPEGQAFSIKDPAGAGMVYYTVDGSDPRVSVDANSVDGTRVPGSISDQAILYTGQAMTFDRMTQVRARILSFGEYSPWSGITEAFFAPGPISANLRVTEIMYHPLEADPAFGEMPVDADSFEYLVLQNMGDTNLDLSGVSVTGGVSFAFRDSLIRALAPGQSVLVVKDLAAFESRYGSGLTDFIAGQYQGKLSNGGETLRVYDATEGVVAEFQYEDAWYPETDGQGDALILRSPEVLNPNAWNVKAAWQAGSGLWTLDEPESGAVQ